MYLLRNNDDVKKIVEPLLQTFLRLKKHDLIQIETLTIRIAMNKILLLLCASLLSTQAMAGSWRYGCIGSQPNKSVVNFNRETLAIVETNAPAIYAANVDISKEIQVGEALDINSGLQPEMDFKKSNGDIIKLIETNSQIISHHEKNENCTGSKIRTFTDDRMLKTYKIVIPGEITVKRILKCYDISISACG